MKVSIGLSVLVSIGRVVGEGASSKPVLDARDFNPDKLATDATWNKFKCKGQQLMGAMKASEQEAAKIMSLPAAQSEWAGELKSDSTPST